MSSRLKKKLSYPFHIQIINILLKSYINIFWTIIDLLSIKSSFVSELFYQKKIREKYDLENKMIKLKDLDIILHIGCGFFPYSALVLLDKNHKSITAIDRNKKIIHSAKKYLQKLQLDEKINLDISDGKSYEFNPFSVIIVSCCVDSTLEIIENIINHAKPNTRIVIRELWPMSKYLKIIIENQKELSIKKQCKHHSFPFVGIFGWNSFIIQKK